MSPSEINTYRWLDAEEMKPQRPADPTLISFDKRLTYKLLDMFDQLEFS